MYHFLPELVFDIFGFPNRLSLWDWGRRRAAEIEGRRRKCLETIETIDKFIVFMIAGESKGGSLRTEGSGRIL